MVYLNTYGIPTTPEKSFTYTEVDFPLNMHFPKWNGVHWVEDVEAYTADVESTRIAKIVDIKKQRSDAYKTEADPLFFMSQRGEATVEAWLAKIEEIKLRYPYP